MHQQILIHSEASHFIPTEYLLFRQHPMITNGMGSSIFHMLIYIITDKHIYTLTILTELLQSVQYNFITLCIQPIVRIYDFQIHASGIGNTRIDRTAVSRILLMDCTTDPWVLHLIFIRNGCCAIAGTIIYNNNLYVLTTRQQ